MPLIVSTAQIIAFYSGAEAVFPIDALPVLNWAEMAPVLMGMLGLGAMRSYEKKNRVD
jgi:hypothetical protein